MAVGEARRRIAVLTRVGRVQRRLNSEVWLTTLVAPAWVGVTVLAIGRIFLPLRTEWLAAGLTALVAAVTIARALPRRFSIDHAAVVADRQAGAGGLLLTRLETAVGEWELGLNQQLKTLPLPKVEVRAPILWLLLAVLFAAAGFWVPRVEHPVNAVNVAAATRVDQLADKIEAIEKEALVPEAIDAELARLQAELDQKVFSATDWEAADSLEKAVDTKAAQTAADLAAAEKAADALAKALENAHAAEQAATERAALEKALMQLGDPKPSQTGKQQGEQQDAKQGGQPGKSETPSTASDAQALRDALTKRREALAKSFGQQQQGNGQKKSPGGGGQGNASNGSSKTKGTGAGAGHGDAPPAELVFGEEANIDPSRLTFEALPQGHGGDEPGELMGLRAVNPAAPHDTPHSAATGATAAGAQAAGHREGPLLPRNRALIERYFQSNHDAVKEHP